MTVEISSAADRRAVYEALRVSTRTGDRCPRREPVCRRSDSPPAGPYRVRPAIRAAGEPV